MADENIVDDNKGKGAEVNDKVQNQQQQQQVIKKDEGKVELDPEVYNALLDRLDELEGTLIKGGGKKQTPQNVDDLAQAVKTVQKQLTEEDLEKMKPKDLISLVVNHINETQIQPLLVKIEEINVKNEIRELKKDPLNKDFDSLKEDIFEIASRNPSLSLEEALVLARQRKGGKAINDKSENRGSLRELLPKRVLGEKPGAARTSVSDVEPETRKDAAKSALAEMRKAGKI